MHSNTDSSLNLADLENTITNAMDRWQVPGLSIALVKDGETVLCKGYGLCDMDNNRPVDAHSRFPIVGTSVSVLAAALAILVGEGKLNWQDRLVDLLPNFKTGDDMIGPQITVIDALSGRTGFGAGSDSLAFLPHPDRSRADILAQTKYLKPVSDFRTELGFSAHMLVAAGEIIPALTGISADDFIRERLFKPLGMTDSLNGPHEFNRVGAGEGAIAVPYEFVGEDLVSVVHSQTATVDPVRSIYCSASDMAKWLNFQLNNGKVGEQQIIPESEFKALRASYMACNFEFAGIANHFLYQGLGLLISDSTSGHKYYSGGGNLEGYESYHAFVPELNLGIAIMINCIQVMPQPLVAWIIDRYTGAPVRDWVNEQIPFYLELEDKVLVDLEQARLDVTDSSKTTSLPIESYCGRYHHPLLGDWVIESGAKAGDLAFTLGSSYAGALLHANHDTFYIKVTNTHYGRYVFNGPAQFRLNRAGEVAAVFAVDNEFQKME